MLSELISKLQAVMDEHEDMPIAKEVFHKGSERYEESITLSWDFSVLEHWYHRDNTKLLRLGGFGYDRPNI